MAMITRTCAFDASDLQRAASAASSPLRIPSEPASPTQLVSGGVPLPPLSPSSKKRVAFCPTTTVFLFDRRLDGGKIPSDAAAPLGLGALRSTVVCPLLTVEAVCPFTRRRPGAMPVSPADRFALLKAANVCDESLDETYAENTRLLQELSDSRLDLMLERAGKRRAAALEADMFEGAAAAADDESDDDADEGEAGEAGEPPAKRMRTDGDSSRSDGSSTCPCIPLMVVVPPSISAL